MGKKELSRRDILIQEICTFINSMKGKSSMAFELQKQMFSLYNEYYNTFENNYGCDLCVIRIFSKLESIKNSYENGK